MPGVISTRAGFAGGTVKAPTYQQVCAGGTGHTEVVEVVYDNRKLPTRALLTEFFTLHDFTKDRRSKNGQYRSVIFLCGSDVELAEQEKTANELLDRLRANNYPPATVLRRESDFYPAGSRHQQYCSSRGIVPKKRQSKEIKKILTL